MATATASDAPKLSRDRTRISDADSAALFRFDAREQIPEWFIRTDEVIASGAAVGEDEVFELPVVDMSKLLDPETSASEKAKLSSALREWGFLHLANHGVDLSVVQSASEFFNLPLESKNTVAFREDDKVQGFGYHFRGGPSVGKLDWAESLVLFTQPLEARKMELWPVNPPSFRDALDKYSLETADLVRRLLGFMADDLGISQEALIGAFYGDSTAGKAQSTASHRYPPCPYPEKVLGITPHSDAVGLTVLLHADDTPGLQIKRDGKWFPVRPLPGALVINVGDILEVLTNGAYTSVEHRVVPDTQRDRTTVVLFQDGSVDGLVTPLPEILKGDEAQARYHPIGIQEFVKGSFTALGEGRRFLDSLRK